MSFASFPVPASVNVNTHVKMTGNKKFECVKCSYKTDWKSNLKTLANSVHENIRPFKCEECPYSSARKIDLEYHINGGHKKLRLYQCDECSYAGTMSKTLKAHI